MKKDGQQGQFLAPQERRSNLKDPTTIQKHLEKLANTGFEGCGRCSGCGGKKEELGGVVVMRCSRYDRYGAYVTESQAAACDGVRPRLVYCLAVPRRGTQRYEHLKRQHS